MVCTICHDEVLLPRLLDCLHVFCQSCIDSLTEEGVIACPECDEETLCKSAKSLPLDPEYNHTANSTIRPRLCVVCGMMATVSCIQCSEDYCENCVASHKKMRALKDHTLTTLPSINNGLQCDNHMMCNLEYYCVTCRSLICLECAVTDHELHERTTLTRAVKDMRDVLDDRKTEFEQEMESIKQGISEIGTKDKKQSDSLYYIQQEIRYARGNIESMLRARETELLDIVKQCSAENSAVLHEKQVGLEQRLDQLSHCLKSTDKILGNASEITVLQMRPYLQKRIETLCERKPPCTAPVYQCTVNFTPANKDQLCAAISAFGNVEERTELNSIGKVRARWEIRNTKFVPQGICFNKSGNVIMVDSGNSKVLEFSVDGILIHKLTDSIATKRFPIATKLCNVAVSDGIGVVVTDNAMLHIISKDGSISTYGIQGTYPGQFMSANGVAVSSAGNILISDSLLDRVSMLSPEGEFILCFGTGKPGSVHTLNKPLGIAVDSKDNVYVADSANHRVAVFNHKGCYLRSIGKEGTMPGEFHTPTDVSINTEGLIAVSDIGTSCVQIFNNTTHVGVVQVNLFTPSNVAWGPDKLMVLSDSANRRVIAITL